MFMGITLTFIMLFVHFDNVYHYCSFFFLLLLFVLLLLLTGKTTGVEQESMVTVLSLCVEL